MTEDDWVAFVPPGVMKDLKEHTLRLWQEANTAIDLLGESHSEERDRLFLEGRREALEDVLEFLEGADD